MKKYHIGRRGKPTACAASEKRCPLGHGTPHFGSIEEANNSIESIYNEQYNILSSLNDWNPEKANKALDGIINKTIANIDNNNYADSVKEVQKVAQKYNQLPETLINKYKEFTNSKEYVDSIHGDDEDRYRKMRNLSLHLVKPVSDNLNNKKEFNENGINPDVYEHFSGKISSDNPDVGSKDWHRKRQDIISPEEAAIIYEHNHGKPNDDIKKKYNDIIKEKSTPYTDEDFAKMEKEYNDNVYLNADEVLAPIITHEYKQKIESDGGFIRQDSRMVENADNKYIQSNINGLITDKTELDDDEIEEGYYSGVLVTTSSDRKWGKHVPPHEVMKAMYITDIAGHDKAVIVNKEQGVFNREYKLDLSDKISNYEDLESTREGYLSYGNFKNELSIFVQNCQHTREQEAMTRGRGSSTDREILEGMKNNPDFIPYDPKLRNI